MDDLISRKAALDAIMGQPPEPHYPTWYAAQIEKLPAVQPDRDVIDDCLCHIYKNELRGIALFGENEPYFCPNCGADMRGEKDE